MICHPATSLRSYIVESASGSIHRRKVEERQLIRPVKRDSILEHRHDQPPMQTHHKNNHTPLSMFPHLIVHFRVGHRLLEINIPSI